MRKWQLTAFPIRQKSIQISSVDTKTPETAHKPTQTTICAIPSDMDPEIQTLEQHLAQTCQMKQDMMQELPTGKAGLVKPAKEALHD